MKKVLINVDDTKGSQSVLSIFRNLVKPPEEVVLLHVQRLEGKSLMIDMLGEAELKTLRESLKDTEHQEKLDRQSEKILDYYKRELESGGLIKIKTVVRNGVTADEVLKVAEEEGIDLIITGSNEERGMLRLIAGSVSRELEKNAKVPVLVGKAADTAEVFGTEPAAVRTKA